MPRKGWLSLGAQGSYPIVDKASTPFGPVYLLRWGSSPTAGYTVRRPDGACERFTKDRHADAFDLFDALSRATETEGEEL